MVEGNSYTLAIVIILGLVAIFLIYWFAIRNKTCDNKVRQYENMTSDGEDDENEGNEDDGNVQENFEVTMKNKDKNRKPFFEAQSFPSETKSPMNGELVGEGNQAEFSNNPAVQQLRQAACFPKEMLTPEELKPQDNSSLWAQVNPAGEGSLKGRSFLQAGHNIGINTVGQTMRNANLQLRSEPPNPQVSVSPWNQTTIEPDTARKPLEIGGCA
jgi:nitrogen fixation-related uncharacterized protein